MILSGFAISSFICNLGSMAFSISEIYLYEVFTSLTRNMLGLQIFYILFWIFVIYMIVKIKNFNLQTIANSGQLFRMNEIDDDLYESVAFNKYLTIKKISKDEFEFRCSESEFKKNFL